MFEDLFEEGNGDTVGQVQSSFDRLPRSCADTLPLPELSRKPGYPIGLKNQGATCYLNSLLQILFHTPELRKTILDLPLCNDTPQNKTDFLNASKHKFMLGFQKLFSEMALKDTYGLSTEYLKDAFGWEGSEHVVQHDIEEAMKIIFDTFERALEGTDFEKNIRDLFKGVSSRYKSCRACTVVEERLEDFYGLNLQVKGVMNIDESMLNFLNAEAMEGDNKIFCETCQSKQDMWLGTKLKLLPNILVLTLTRFTFDYERFDRVKLSDFFSYNLEYNFEHLIEDSKESVNYELYGVLIHRGSAHSGHYFCYIRDILQESDWLKGLQEAEKIEQENKEKEEKEKEAILTEEQKSRKQEKNKEEKGFDLEEPNNKKLLENWFELDDSRVTAIDAKKITTKYEGSESAYILFYRRKGAALPESISVPEYFSKIIKEENEVLKSERSVYEAKRNQIILKIEGENQELDISTKIIDLIAMFCDQGEVLVNVAKHNGLPYYPKELNSLKEYSEEETIKSLDLIHESTWKKYLIDSDEYRDIKDLIEVNRVPFEINLFFNDNNEKITLYEDQTLNDLKLRIQNKFNFPYESQIIKLTTAFRECFVTDDLSNDDVLLKKLGFMHECQVILKKIEAGENKEDVKKIEDKVETNTICFVIERDDVHGIKRMYFEKTKTLKELFDFVVESEDLETETVLRFRNLNGDRLFYDNQYEQKLQDLDLTEEIVKLRIERGEVPVKGDICVIAKIQSKFQAEGGLSEVECIFDPNATILEVKTKICELTNLEPEKHRLYQTDWMGEPTRSMTKEKQSIFDARFGKEEKMCLRDIESPIGSELMIFDVYITKNGTPEDVGEAVENIKIEEFKTVGDLKAEILKTSIGKDKDIKLNQVRVREIKKDYMFGTILRDNSKELKNFTFNANKIVVQILPFEEQLTESQIVLLLKKRNKEKRIYENGQEFVFEAGKAPSIDDLYSAVKNHLQVKEEENIVLAKYVYYDFEWLEICEKSIEKFLKGKSANVGNTNNKKKGKEGKKGEKAKEVVEAEKETKKEENEEKIELQEESKVEEQTEQSTETQSESKLLPEHENEGSKVKPKEKKAKKNKEPQRSKEELKKEDCKNLRKVPFMLKDGDWVGYGVKSELEEDDLQTDEDNQLRILKRNEKAVAKTSRGAAEKGFKVNIDF